MSPPANKRLRGSRAHHGGVELLMVGDELLDGTVVDTNGAWLGSRLRDLGLRVMARTSVPDHLGDLVRALKAAARRSSAVIVTGGLGPTADDVTAEAAAKAAGVDLVRDEKAMRQMRRRLGRLGLDVPLSNEKQAFVPAGAAVLYNDRGTAPGFAVDIADARCFFLPGVPFEMRRMFDRQVSKPLVARSGSGATVARTLHLFGLPEAAVGEIVEGSGITADADLDVGYRAAFPEIHVKLVGRGADRRAARAVVRKAERRLRRDLARQIVGVDGDNLPIALGALLEARGETMATAESCTGGMVGKLLTDQAGASGWFLGGVISYSNEAKVALLGVPEKVIATHGAVSAECAQAMAKGARKRFDAAWAVSITGVAGPGGGSPEKPVGTVHVGVAHASAVESRQLFFPGDRERVRVLSAWSAMEMLRRRILRLAAQEK